MHQLVEYILGGALVASGLQSPYPVMPAVLGGLIMVHAAMTKGALAAFSVIDRRIHRLIDPLIILLVIFSALRPWADIDDGTRVIILGIAAVHSVVWLSSSFAEKPKKVKSAPAAPVDPSDRSGIAGQKAGRMAASGVLFARRQKDKFTSK
jgi:hypothetical protein